MPNLETYLSEIGGPRLTWIQATVLLIGDGFLNLTYSDGVINNAAYLDQYTPQIGDQVHALSFEPIGVLVLGTTTASSPGPADPTPQTPQIFSPTSFATYDRVSGVWTSAVLLQDTDKIACFFYSATGFISLTDAYLQQVEIEITRTSGGPPAFVAHSNIDTVSAPFVQEPDSIIWRSDIVLPVGVPTWVSLPIGWGQDLVSGVIKGLGIWTELDTQGVYSGTGRVRLTPLSVTI